MRPSLAAASSSSTEPILSSSQTRFAFLGPRPGRRISSISDRGTSASSSSRKPSVPVSTISWMWFAISLPIPGRSVSGRFSSTHRRSGTVSVSTVRTALR